MLIDCEIGVCPKCRSDAVLWEEPIQDDGTVGLVIIKCSCARVACGAQWLEHYTFEGIEIMEEDK